VIFRISSSVQRGFLVSIAFVLAGGLAYSSLRRAVAEHYAAMGTRQGLERATELEPNNAYFWYLLGRNWQYSFKDTDEQRAVQDYRKALSLGLRSADTWLDLAFAYEFQGDQAAAKDAYLEAKKAYPASPEVSWRYGNFLLRQGDVKGAFGEMHHALEADPARAREASLLCWRILPDINTLLNSVFPANRDVYLNVIRDFVSRRETVPALSVWTRLVSLRPQLSLPDTYPLVDELLAQGHVIDAQQVWNEGLQMSATRLLRNPSDSVLWDGGFEYGVKGSGFAWRYPGGFQGMQSSFDSHEKHSGKYSVRLQFNGTQNVDSQEPCAFAAVQPSTLYRFSAWVKTDSLTSNQGLRFRLETPEIPHAPAAVTPDVQGTQPWQETKMAWKSEKGVHLVVICVCRYKSWDFDKKVSGIAWVDDVALSPVAAELGKP
jgi:tetratricopeptide (TPR) repeat protein